MGFALFGTNCKKVDDNTIIIIRQLTGFLDHVWR
jgi:hypothetical protein